MMMMMMMMMIIIIIITTIIISPYYKHTPANVLENDNFKLYWNRSIITDKAIPSNRPNITFMNKKKPKKTFLLDIAVPNTHNLAKTIRDKKTNTENWRMK
jgi:hypothetical protein